MRLAPIVIAAFSSRGENQIKQLAQVSARETHYSYEAEAATEVFAMLLYSAVLRTSKTDVIDVSRYSSGNQYDTVLKKLQLSLDPNEIKDKQGYVIYTLQIALWGFMQHDTFEDGMLAVMGLGGDVDTTMAVYGQLAGAYYEIDAIPDNWRRDVYLGDEIVQLADRLAIMKSCDVLQTRFEEDVTIS
jgi:ADP-ribosyl-[dinitrogen reductase] hydrolase